MSRTSLFLGLCAAVLLAGASCGGGGGGGTPGPTTIATLQSNLSGAEEVGVVDADARGTILLEVRSDGLIRFGVTAQPSYVADITSVHVRRGGAGTAGTSVVDLLSGGATFDMTSASASGEVSVDVAVANEIAATPDDFYVNIHTTGAPDGIVRSQLGQVLTGEWHVRMTGDQETNVIDALAAGAATFRFDGTSLAYVIALANPPVADVNAAHIHVGLPGVNGAVLVNLNVDTASRNVAQRTITGSVQVPFSAASRILTDPSGFYCNVHTAVAPDGIVRGQLATGTVEFWAALKGDQETDVIDANARGGCTIRLNSFTTGSTQLAVPSDEIDIFDITDAHVHDAPVGVNGAVVIDLQGGADYGGSTSIGAAEGSITCNQNVFTRMYADPSAFYANFHTAGAPDGLVRGQLTREPQTFFASLRGDEELDVIDASVQGAISVVFTGIARATINLTLSDPPSTDVDGLHIHDGPAATNGPVLANLLIHPDLVITAGSIAGPADVTGRTFTRMLAAPENFYCNAHTAVAPDGIARGQMQHAPNGLPPAGISYATPVSYETGKPIAQNAPEIAPGGGGITNFSITPALPTGLGLNSTTGVIAGTPSVAAVGKTYVVTASNSAGSVTADIVLEVVDGPPTSLNYVQNPAVYTVNQTIAPNLPQSAGGAITNFAVIAGALPTGLNLSGTSGLITGTPTVTTAGAVDVTIRGSNSGGFVDVVLKVTVNATLLPPSISYSTPVSYKTGFTITPNTPTNTGGQVASYAAVTTLPAGLQLNTTTGAITGKPTTVDTQKTFMIQATNAAGSHTANVQITITLGEPTNLTYTPSSQLGYTDTMNYTWQDMTPTSEGGAVASYSITPALQTGLTFSTTTGVISGSPTIGQDEIEYTVTATNATGSTTTKVYISVLDF